jgi:hypothetical protein
MRVSSASALSSSVRVKTSSSLRAEDGVALARRTVAAPTSFAGVESLVPRNLEPPPRRASGVPSSRRLADDEGERRAALLTEPQPFVAPLASHWGLSASEREFVPTRRISGGALGPGNWWPQESRRCHRQGFTLS